MMVSFYVAVILGAEQLMKNMYNVPNNIVIPHSEQHTRHEAILQESRLVESDCHLLPTLHIL